MRLNTIRIFIVLLLPSMLMAGNAMAGNRAGATNLSFNYGLYQYEGDQNLENNTNSTFGLGLGYNLTENFGVEALANIVNGTDVDRTSNEVDGTLYRLEALYHFAPSNQFVPYVAVGAGNMVLNPEVGTSEDTFGASYGVGMKSFLAEDMALRFDVRHFIAFDQGLDEGNHTDNNLIATVGLNFQLGGNKPVSAPRDSDGDGVTDDLDKCPDTPKGVAVDASGCPLDSDGDGVPDYLDKCPDTPRGAPVDSNGCPLDSDGDGVYDYLDKCPGTPRGVIVDNVGCPVSFTLEIEFDYDKADVRPGYHDKIAEAAAFIRKYPAPQILVAGHTDSRGTDQYNQKLSERRAANVRKYLIEKFGIGGDKLVPKGYGESQPVATNETDAGRQKNRRVEVVCCTIIPK